MQDQNTHFPSSWDICLLMAKIEAFPRNYHWPREAASPSILTPSTETAHVDSAGDSSEG